MQLYASLQPCAYAAECLCRQIEKVLAGCHVHRVEQLRDGVVAYLFERSSVAVRHGAGGVVVTVTVGAGESVQMLEIYRMVLYRARQFGFQVVLDLSALHMLIMK